MTLYNLIDDTIFLGISNQKPSAIVFKTANSLWEPATCMHITLLLFNRCIALNWTGYKKRAHSWETDVLGTPTIGNEAFVLFEPLPRYLLW